MTVSKLNILCKFRVLLTGWQLGTRAKGDPEGDAVRDQREALLVHRVELTALTALLISKGVLTAQEFTDQIEVEAEFLTKALEEKFLGVTAHEDGLRIDLKVVQAAGTFSGWKP